LISFKVKNIEVQKIKVFL